MEVLAIKTPVIKAGDDLANLLLKLFDFEEYDILVISSKAVATAEGAAIDLRKVKATPEAEDWAKRSGRSAEFRQAVLDETERMHGKVIASTLQLMMTELKPDGMTEGTVLVPNAGLDESNADGTTAIGWSHDPIHSAQKLREDLEARTGKKIAVIISDSCSRPRRLGVTAFALTVAGIDPIKNLIGAPDLFGKELHLTQEAIADQLATAANFLMGNANECIPAAVIRDHGVPFTNYCGWVPGIEPDRDMFGGVI